MKTVALGEIATWGSGGTPSRSKREYFGDGLPWLSITDLNDGPVGEAKESLTELGLKHSSAKAVPPGTLLVAMYGSIGKLGIATRELCTSQAIAFAIPDANRVHTRYFFHFLLAERRSLLARGRGGTQSNIGQGDLKSWKMPLLPLSEQRRIAEVLDRADALRTKRRAALAQLDSLTQSIFLDMFGDPAANPKAWPRIVLGELAVNGFQNGLYKHSSHYGTGTPILRIDAFYDGVVTGLDTLKRLRASASEIETYGLRESDVVVNRVNSIEYLGKSAIVPFLREPVVFESNMMRFAIDRKMALPSYVVAFLQSGFIKRQIGVAAKQAVNQASINQTDVAAFQFNIPPLSVQQTFVDRIIAIEALKTTHRAALAELDALFASLQHRAFRGEL